MAIPCPNRTFAACRGIDVDVLFGDDPNVVFGPDAEVVFGSEIGGTCEAAVPVVVPIANTVELPCDEDIPFVQFHQAPVSGLGVVFVQWYGDNVSYDIEYLVMGKLSESIVGGEEVYATVHHIDDTGKVADVATGSIGSAEVGVAMMPGKIYSISLRRVTNTAVGVWSQAVFNTSDTAFPTYIVDGDNMITDNTDDLAPTMIIDA